MVLPQVEKVLETVLAAISDINERLASLERSLVTGDARPAGPAEHMEDQQGSPLPSDGPSYQLDADLESGEDVAVASGGLPVLGLIPEVDHWKGRRFAIRGEGTREERTAAEAYRALRTSVLFLGVDRQMRSIQVTSPLQGEGKTMITANLAFTMAQAGHRVIAMCCDLRRPRLHEYFGLSNETGFSSVLHKHVPLQSVVKQVPGIPTLKLVAAGPVPTNPSELVLSSRAGGIIKALQAQCDILLIDCPPVLPVTDAVAISQRVEATIIVVNAGLTSRHDLHRTVGALQQVGAPLLGTVVNGIATDHSGYGLGQGARVGKIWGTPS